MKQRWARILLYAVLVGWCLLFLRCETTEKSMIRVVYLEQKEQTWSVGLLYQSPEAAADAADASAALRIADARGQTLETALAAAEGTLPQTADYRLCDYLLFPVQTDDGVLSAYEALVLERGCGRTAADFPARNLIWKYSCSRAEKRRLCPTNCWTNSKRARRQCPGCMHTRKACCFLCFACPKHRKGK